MSDLDLNQTHEFRAFGGDGGTSSFQVPQTYQIVAPDMVEPIIDLSASVERSQPSEQPEVYYQPPEQSQVYINRLGNELSPYLQQHANNPVAWYPWGPEAFAVAQQENKPIFLSIGYSSCHWCHVMERECFNDTEVAELMNNACVAIKVDREERPDLDDLFMEVCLIQNEGNGGWPLNLFLTPDGFPFFATTWLPKRTRGQMPGLTDIIPRVKWLWLMQHEAVIQAASSLTKVIADRSKFVIGSRPRNLKASAAREALDRIRQIYDPVWGGFVLSQDTQNTPKFPEPVKLLFLLYSHATRYAQSRLEGSASDVTQNGGYSRSTDYVEPFTMVDVTLRRMWRGGIHDHLGGGFCRYAADSQWIVPHFEKLLADQAMLLLVVSLAQELKPDPFYVLMAEDLVKCVTREFSEPDNAEFPHPCFLTSIDADNYDGEGRYYLWRDDEIHAILPEGDAGLFCAAYAVMPSGNFGAEVAGSQIGYNILYETSSVTELARRYGLRGPEVSTRLARDRDILLMARSQRPAPPRDNKVLMSWNGLMIGALARASTVFNKPDWRTRAMTAANFLQKNLVSLKSIGQGQLQIQKGEWARRWCQGQAGIPALPDDYAALLWGIMQLYRAESNAEKNATKDSVPLPASRQIRDLIKYAEDLADSMVSNYWDENSGGLFLTPKREIDANIFVRYKTASDGIDSLPSANAMAVLALSELAHAESVLALASASDSASAGTSTSGNAKKYMDLARKIISCFARSAEEYPIENLSLIIAASISREIRTKIDHDFAEFKRATAVSVNLKIDEATNAADADDIAGGNVGESAGDVTEARAQRAQRRAARAGRTGGAPGAGSDVNSGSNVENQRRLARDTGRRDRALRREHRTQRRGR